MANGWFENAIRKIVVFVGLGLVYFKTAEVMVQFSPRTIAGWADPNIGTVWAYVAAGLVEGVAYLAFQNLLNLRKDAPTKKISWGIAIGAVLFSATLNWIDQQITDGRMVLAADNPVANILHLVLGLLPLIVACSFAAMEIVDRYYADAGQTNQRRGLPVMKTESSFGRESSPPSAAYKPQAPGYPQISGAVAPRVADRHSQERLGTRDESNQLPM